MTDRSPSDVLGALPRTRPHRRSDKRASRAAPPEADGRVAAASKPKAPSSGPRAAPAAKAATAKPKAATARPKAAGPKAAGPKAATPKAATPKAPTPKAPRPKVAAPRPKLAAVPPPAEQVQPTPFYTPPVPRGSRVAAQKAAKPAPSDEKVDVLGTAVQAAAELAEIGISATARAIRGAVARLPRP